jgi:hypothetical protein
MKPGCEAATARKWRWTGRVFVEDSPGAGVRTRDLFFISFIFSAHCSFGSYVNASGVLQETLAVDLNFLVCKSDYIMPSQEWRVQ